MDNLATTTTTTITTAAQEIAESSSDENAEGSLRYISSKYKESWDDGKFFRWKKIFVRSAHLFLVLFISGNLLVQKTRLHDALINRQFVYLFSYVGLTYASLVFYFITCLKNPGYVERGDVIPLSQPSQDLPTIKLRYCTICDLEQPIRSRHCEECKKCINKFDHHCPWLETCIGDRNHRYFWLFLGSTTCLIIWSIVISYDAIVHFEKSLDWFVKNLLILFDMQVLVIGLVVTLALFIIHTYFMLTNTTTWERFSRKNITYLRIIKHDSYNPFNHGYLRNVYLFLCAPNVGRGRWDKVYATFVKNSRRLIKTSNARSDDEEEEQLQSDNEVEIKLESLSTGNNIRIN